MKIELSVAASFDESAQLIGLMTGRGFNFTEDPKHPNSVSGTKSYCCSETGKQVADITIGMYGFNDGAFFELSYYVTTYSYDALTGEKTTAGTGMNMATQNTENFTHHVLFMDSALTGPACNMVVEKACE